MKKLVYAGTFDPPTRGHLWMISEALKLADELIIAVGTNPEKAPAFALNERLEMLELLRKSELAEHQNRVTVTSFAGKYLADFVRESGADALLRGLRSGADFDHEQKMLRISHRIDPDLRTIYLMPPLEIAEISSSTVRALVGFDGWNDVIAPYLPPSLHATVVQKFQ